MQKKTSPAKLIVGDTSALVSLQTGGLLQDSLSIAQLFVPHLKRVTTAKVHLSADLIAGLVVRRRISLDEAEAVFDRIASKRNWLDAEIYQHAKRYLDALVD